MRSLLFFVLLVFALHKPLQAQEVPLAEAPYVSFSQGQADKITNYFLRRHKLGVFNGAYLFFKRDSLIEGYSGYANFKTRDTLRQDDLFQLASVSKTYTAVATMLLYQEGYLHIDDSVHWHLPNLSIRNLTIRMLLSHKSGLPDYFDFSGRYWPYPDIPMNDTDVINMLNLLPPKYFKKANSVYEYCNTNYVLLACIIEKITGLTFPEFMHREVFLRCGMKRSHVRNCRLNPLESYAVQGWHQGSTMHPDHFQNGTYGDKNVYSSVDEMFLFDRALRSPYLLHSEIREQMYTPNVPTTSSGQYYGLGWRITYKYGKKWVFHNGWWKGFRTYYWRCLSDDICIVVLTNNVQGGFLSTSHLVDLLENPFFQDREAVSSGKKKISRGKRKVKTAKKSKKKRRRR